MTFQVQRLGELKKIENGAANGLYDGISMKIINQVWPSSNKKRFNEIIQDIGVKWMNQFLVLIENWLAQSSAKFIKKLSQLKNFDKKQPQINQIEEYLLNFSNYIRSMEYPFITSLSNIYNLYLKFPTDEMIQSPLMKSSGQKTLSKTFSNMSSGQLKKKKSFSIDSFTSNLPTRSRSSSKSRKISFFNNSSKEKPNFFQTLTKDFNQKEKLNTTVRKVKKEFTFSKKNHETTSSFKQQPSIKHNQNQCHHVIGQNAKLLKQRLQERLSKTSSQKLFNRIILQVPQESHEKSPNLSVLNSISQEIVQQKCQNEIKAQKISSPEDLKKQIFQQISQKDKQNYERLVNDIEVKMNNKFDLILQKILQQKSASNSSIKQTQSTNQVQQISYKLDHDNKVQKQSFLTQPQAKKEEKTSPKYEPNPANYQSPHHSNNKSQNLSSSFENNQTFQLKSDSKSKINSSIIQNDPSKIIKSKAKNTSILQNTNLKKELISQKVVQQENKQRLEKLKSQQNKVESQSSIDEIDIIDIKKTNASKNNVKPKPQIKQTIVSENANPKPIQKKEDNFYMKRIKEQKSKMESSIKSFKSACDSLVLPVNESFLVLFSLVYKSFCEGNSFSMQSPEANHIIFSKYSSESELYSKLPTSEQRFLIDSLIKIQKMVNLKCASDKKLKIQDYTKSCISCIQNVFFQKQNLELKNEAEIIRKIGQIKNCLPTASK